MRQAAMFPFSTSFPASSAFFLPTKTLYGPRLYNKQTGYIDVFINISFQIESYQKSIAIYTNWTPGICYTPLIRTRCGCEGRIENIHNKKHIIIRLAVARLQAKGKNYAQS